MKFLLVCGGGASSSFVAQNVQKAANEAGLNIEVNAISETELDDYAEDQDVILLGPHLKYMEEGLAETINYYGVPFKFIEEQDYAKMDGKAILNDALNLIKSHKGE